MHDVTEEYKTLVAIAEKTGGVAGSFGSEDAIYVVVHGNHILASHALPGVLIEATETDDGIDAKYYGRGRSDRSKACPPLLRAPCN